MKFGLNGWTKATLALALGAVQALSMAWPWPGPWLTLGQPSAFLQVLALTGLVLLLLRTSAETAPAAPAVDGGMLEETTTRLGTGGVAWPVVWRSALLGWLFAIGWLCGCFWWLFISMHQYGGLPAPLAALAVLALAAFLGLYVAAACAFAVCLMGAASGGLVSGKNPQKTAFVQYPRYLFAIVFASCWMLAELARAQWFTGFPWGSTGYAHVDGLAAWLAPWVGVYGLGWAVAALCAFWAWL